MRGLLIKVNLLKCYRPLLIGILLAQTYVGVGQENALGYYQDALRFSNTTFGGSARFQGLAGINVALGGDITNAYMNPAGLGFNRRSEFSITPAINYSGTAANYSNPNVDGTFVSNTTDSRLNLSFEQVGMLIANAKNNNSSKFFGGSFAMAFTRINDFNNQFTYEGTNDSTSIIDFFLDQTDQRIKTSFFEDENELGVTSLNTLAYFTYLINPESPFADNNLFYSFIEKSPTRQRETITTKGGQYQWSISYGANYDDLLYFGASIGVQTIKYTQEKAYTETVLGAADAGLPLNSLQLTERLSILGVGANITVGLIIRTSDYFRFGISLTSPTLSRINDRYTADLTVNYNNYSFDNYKVYQDFFLWEANQNQVSNPTQYAKDSAESYSTQRLLKSEAAATDDIKLNYTLLTPFVANFGLASFIGKHGFITANMQIIGYDNIHLSNPDAAIDFSKDNRAIKENYQTTINFNVGAELRLKQYRLRGGFAQYGSPFQEQQTQGKRSYITGGIGIRKKAFYFDTALTNSLTNATYTPYTFIKDNSGTPPKITLDNNRIKIVFSLGMFF